MFQEPPREKRWHSWLFFVSLSAFIWRLAPLMRSIVALGPIRGLLVNGTIVVTVMAGLVGGYYVVRNPRMRSFPRVVSLLLVVCGYAWICLHELKAPQEALHFLEYGFLGLLAFRALSHDIHTVAIYPAAVLLCGLVGNVDEALQWLMPNRLWDMRDWLWDMSAGALSQLAIAGGMVPPFVQWRFRARSWRVVARIAFLQVLLMGICLSVTPARCVWLGWRVPVLRFLVWHENVMTEYGHLHHIEGIGSMYSRFTLAELREIDSVRHEEAADIIREYRNGPGYAVFLREVNAGVDPFTHEAYVHIFRRNHYMLSSFQYRNRDAEAYTYHCRVAFRENQMLDKFFPLTTGYAGETLPPWEYVRLKRDMDATRPYTSPVSEHLITRFTEPQVRLIVACLLLLLAGIDLKLRDKKHETG